MRGKKIVFLSAKGHARGGGARDEGEGGGGRGGGDGRAGGHRRGRVEQEARIRVFNQFIYRGNAADFVAGK